MRVMTHHAPLDPALQHILKNPFSTLEKIDATIHRLQPGRKTISFILGDQVYFAKIHMGVGWKEILKNIIQLRWPIVGAETEWKALLKLKALNIGAPIPIAFGKKGVNPASFKSFIVTKALENTINLDEFFSLKNRIDFKFKYSLIKTVATIARKLHENGVNHRDFYLCHFLLDKSQLEQSVPIIYLIDLHRAQIRRSVPFRWKIKDIGGLYFSTMDFEFTRGDYLRFVRYFMEKSLRKTFKEDGDFWKAVVVRADRLYKKHHS
jgi:hypothetical protein